MWITSRLCRAWVLASVCAIALSAAAGAPRAAWSYIARSNLYAAPVVADVHPAPGLEILIADSEVRTLRCVSSLGDELWNYRGPWTKRQASSAAASMTAREGVGTIAIANGNGIVCALDAQTGSELWRKAVVRVDRGGLLWADLDGDARDELVVCGDDGVARAFRANGDALWASDATATAMPGRFVGALAAADIDGDSAAELFGVTEWGAACLTGAGALRWAYEPGARCVGAPIVYRDGDGAKLAFASRVPAAVHVVRVETGEVLWRAALIESPDDYTASGLAAGDLDGDGVREIVACDARGHVHCFSNGALRWLFDTDKAANAMASIADVTGDGAPEVLVAGGDRTLYGLDAHGAPVWRYETGARLLHPPTIADVDRDEKADILIGGGDHVLRRFATDAPIRPETAPWPSRRADASLAGAQMVGPTHASTFARHARSRRNAPQTRTPLTAHAKKPANGAVEFRELLRDGGSERTTVAAGPPGDAEAVAHYAALRDLPNGWLLESAAGALARDTSRKRTGAACARIEGGAAGAAVVSQPVALDDETASVHASAFVQCEHDARVRAALRWIGPGGVMREDALRALDVDAGGWRQYDAGDRKRPRGARYVQIALRVDRGSA
ncbi:MAG: hypothetical protein FJY92_03960, partial [Candidatus Hydrogenedentes bacterium]|nr:hypothetical protein [Candidatus Hydrogenedentota bacterium]